MGKNVKTDFNELFDNDVRRNYGGLNFLNLSCLPSSPDKSTYHFGMEFLKILPSLLNDMKTPSEDLQKYYSEATSKTESFIEHARAVTKDAKADPAKRDVAANVVGHPLMGMAFVVEDPSLRDVATQKSSIMMHTFKSMFPMDTVKADWERLTDAPQRKMPQFDF